MSDLTSKKQTLSGMNYRTLNTITGWLVFIIATATYLLTIEPTTSFWDCGEFIASAYKLEVGHPPGAPLFMISAKVFSLLAGGDVTKVAMMVNSLSAMASSFTILFLFWTITYFAQKIARKSESEYTTADLIAILGSGVVGALAYTFSDTFWFSAVEGEVYALSSFFTAIVFWAILKWEHISEEKYANRWLIFIAYMMGLSIGVHLLNLLAIPAIVFVYYFKKYKTTRAGIYKASAVAVLILGAIMYGVIPGVVKIASWFELMFVNGFGLPYKSGAIFYMALIFGGIVWGIRYTTKHKKVLANTLILSFTVILIGYSSFTMIVIRSIADTPMNENRPDNVFSLLSYLNREQYGDRPLLYGQYFNAPVEKQETKYTYVQKNGRYEKIPMTNPEYKYSSEFSTIFPRMYSHQSNHKSGYKSWTNLKDDKKKPNFFRHNLAFFFGYQINHMYIRYFMWNFAGRQNDLQGHGNHLKGNWLSGIPFIDNLRLGPQDKLPESMKSNKARNNYYMLPLILGIIGMIFLYQKRPKQFVVVLLLFFFTGIAIVIYLNQPPYQPRERDYAYAGSFYAFAIWIGLGVMAITEWLKKLAPSTVAAILASGLTLIFIPGIMASENWDDHDRSGRYTARDLAKNYLNSCAPNAILFTYGDNDTFPLWYVQEVEGFRTDVRVVNLSLLGTDWYIDQMKKKAYESEPVPFSFTSDKYEQGTRDILPVIEKYKDPVLLKDVMEFVESDDERTKVGTHSGETMDFIPAKKVVIPVDSLKVVNSGLVKGKMIDSILPAIGFMISKRYVTKSDMMVLDLVANFNWDRPVYFASSVGNDNYMGLQNYFRLEGFAYRLVPFQTVNKDGNIGHIDTDILYNNLMNKFVWGRMNEPDVLIENYNIRVLGIMKIRDVFYRLADALIKEGKKEKAEKVLDKIVKLTPNDKLPFDYFMVPIAETYYKLNKTEKANALVKELADIYIDNASYYLSLEGSYASAVGYETKVAMSVMQELVQLTDTYKQDKLFETLTADFDVLLQKYMVSEQSK